MKILFLVFKDNEKLEFYQLAPLYLEAYCRNKIDMSWDIEIIDIELPKIYEQYDLIALSNCFFDYNEFKNLCLYLKNYCKLLVGGGPMMKFFDEKLLKNNVINGICYGPGEKPFLELLKSLKINKEEAIKFMENHQSWKTPKTINKEIIFSELSEEELNDIPYLNFYLYKQKVMMTTLLLQEGCNGCCTFCTVSQIHTKTKTKTLDTIKKELDFYANSFSKYFYLVDDDPFTDWSFYKPILEYMVEKKYKIMIQNLQWNSLFEEQIMLLKKIYVDSSINLNPDAGCERVYKEIVHKRGDFKKIKKVISLLKQYKFTVVIKILIGYPGETKEEIDSYENLRQEWDYDNIYIDQVLPFKDTELRKICDDNNYFYEDMDKNIYEVNTPEWNNNWLKNKIDYLMKRLN